MKRKLMWWINVKRLEFMMYRHSHKAMNYAHKDNYKMFCIHRQISALYAEEMFKEYKEGLR